MKFNDYVLKNIILADGAMGTYFSEKTGSALPFCELGNIKMPHIVKEIHEEYIAAGSHLITTNTFSANTFSLSCSRKNANEIVQRGLDLARSACVGPDMYIASDIGPIPEIKDGVVLGRDAVMEEYMSIVDVFLEEGSDIFLFETFGSLDYLPEMASYIKSKNKDSFVLTSFAVQPDGYLRKGTKVGLVLEAVSSCKDIDSWGLNCGCGPTHLLKIASCIKLSEKPCSIMPNAGYPEIINNRMVYNSSPQYFANTVSSAVPLGFRIVGGCCGTTPEYIRNLKQSMEKGSAVSVKPKASFIQANEGRSIHRNDFRYKLTSGKFVIACEIDPPFDSDIKKGLEAARSLKVNGVDIITVADSPMAKPRMDSVSFAAKLSRETGIDTMPHITCRDRNTNSLKSSILAAHMEGIRNILAVTGDAIPEGDTAFVKPVFNLNSVKLIEMVSNINKNLFEGDELLIGAAANLNAVNRDAEALKMIKKTSSGASFFLTQPVFCEDTIEYIRNIKNILPKEVKILAGIMPLVSYRNALFLANEIPGITIPQEHVDLFSNDMTREKAQETGIKLALGIIEKVFNYIDGLYLITPFNRVEIISDILQRVN